MAAAASRATSSSLIAITSSPRSKRDCLASTGTSAADLGGSAKFTVGSLAMLNAQSVPYDSNKELLENIFQKLKSDNFGFSLTTLPATSIRKRAVSYFNHLKGSLAHAIGRQVETFAFIQFNQRGEVSIHYRYGSRAYSENRRLILNSIQRYVDHVETRCLLPIAESLWVAAWEKVNAEIIKDSAKVTEYIHIPERGFELDEAEHFNAFNAAFIELNTSFETCFYKIIQRTLQDSINQTPSDEDYSPIGSDAATPERMLNAPIFPESLPFDMCHFDKAMQGIFTIEQEDPAQAYNKLYLSIKFKLEEQITLRKQARLEEIARLERQIKEEQTRLEEIAQSENKIEAQEIARLERQAQETQSKLLERQASEDKPTWAAFLITLHQAYKEAHDKPTFKVYSITINAISQAIFPTCNNIFTSGNLAAYRLLRILPSALIELHKAVVAAKV